MNSMSFIDDLFQNYQGVDKPKESMNDRERCSTSLEDFAMTYFPDIFFMPFNAIHREIFASLEDILFNKQDRHNYFARAIPRRSGKSQIVSFLLPLFCICYKLHMNILIVSETQDQSRNFSLGIRGELEDNEKLIDDFGDLTSNLIWSADKFLCSNGVYLSCKSMGGRLRGIKYRQNRPSLIILDDCDGEDNTNTEELRKKAKQWLHSVLFPCSAARATFAIVGTIVHSDAILENVLTLSKYNNFDRKKYRAITKFSECELWDTWHELMQDEENPNSADQAYKLFKDNQTAMLNGVECFWQNDENYYMELMIMKLQNPSSYAQEYLNECIIEENRIFTEEILSQCMYEGEPPEEILKYYISLDPSLAKNNKSDYSGLTVIGLAKSGKMYVVEAIEKRIKPHDLIEVAIFYAIKYYSKLGKFAIETTVWQAFFADELKKVATERGLYIEWAEMKPKAGNDKDMRIKTLAPKFKQGYLFIRSDMKNLINELLLYPVCAHDDVIDSLCQNVACIGSTSSSGFSFASLPSALQSRKGQSFASPFQRLLNNRR